MVHDLKVTLQKERNKGYIAKRMKHQSFKELQTPLLPPTNTTTASTAKDPKWRHQKTPETKRIHSCALAYAWCYIQRLSNTVPTLVTTPSYLSLIVPI